jgi:hypothetical protein
VAKQRFDNTSPLAFSSMLSDDKNLAEQLAGHIHCLSTDAYAVIEPTTSTTKSLGWTDRR